MQEMRSIALPARHYVTKRPPVQINSSSRLTRDGGPVLRACTEMPERIYLLPLTVRGLKFANVEGIPSRAHISHSSKRSIVLSVRPFELSFPLSLFSFVRYRESEESSDLSNSHLGHM